MNTHLCDGNLVVCDRERRLSQHGIHRQRRLHLRRQDALLLLLHMTEGHRLKSRIDNGFIVFLKLIKPMTSQFWIKVLCAVCSSAPWIHVSIKVKKQIKKPTREVQSISNQTTRYNPKQLPHTFKVTVSRSTCAHQVTPH